MTKKLLALLLVIVLLFAGCSGETVITANVEQVELSFSWWGNDVRHEYTLEAIKAFEAQHPGINVVCHYSDWSGYQLRSDAQMASATEADVMLINYAWIQQYSPNGDAYYDINTLTDYIDLSNFTEEELDYGMQEGKLNALSTALNTQTVYINKTVYEQYGLDIPQTWDDYFAAAKVMNGEIYPMAMVAKSLWFFTVAYAEQELGKQFMTLDGELLFGPEDIQVMIDFYCRLVNEQVIPQPEYFDSLKLSTGEYAATMAWVSDASSHCSKAIENGYEMVIGEYPVNTGGTVGDGWYAKPATMYAISANTDYPEEAAMLLDFLVNSEDMAKLQGVEKGVPVSAAARRTLEENDMLTGIQYEAFLKMNEHTESIAVISAYFENSDMIDDFRNACNAVLFDKAGVEEEAQLLYEQFTAALS